jgi:hypothetical protein
MANKFTCPPQVASGSDTFSDNLVGVQLVAGGGLTQGNFNFTTAVTEKVNRTFSIGVFSNPMSLDSMGITDVNQARTIIENNFKVYPNFDLTQVLNYTTYGSMVKRMSAAITTIISYYPAAIESTAIGLNYTSGTTATNIVYNDVKNETTFDLDVARLRNPFEVDFTINSTRNLQLREVEVSPLRDMTLQYANYSLYYLGNGYNVTRIIPTNSLSSGILTIYVAGNPFSGSSEVYDDIIVRPNDSVVSKTFNEDLDEIENFLLNRNVSPIYTSSFKVPVEAEDGTFYIENRFLSWPLYGRWNLDILTANFQQYLVSLNQVSEYYDNYKTNLISRFLTTGAFNDFDTEGRKIEKVLQIYGRSFDDVQKFISALSFMTSVNYNVGNDIPSQLLRNLALTLGWSTNISPVSNDEFLSSIFGQVNNDKSNFTGVSTQTTPDELNYQYYRNVILNSAYLFKSKGTRKSIESLLRMIGAPEALTEFNEYVYLADQRINLDEFNTYWASISGGTYISETPTLEEGNVFSIQGITYTGFTTTNSITSVNLSLSDYPIDNEGYPSTPQDSEDYFFQIGGGWFEQTPQHRGPEVVEPTFSTFTGQSTNLQTSLLPPTYGQIYLNRFRKFPFMNLGFILTPQIDNNKSWYDNEIGLRSNLDGNLNARYNVSDDKLVLNVKNVDIFMNPAQGILYDVWAMSRKYDYPIPNQGLNYVQPTYCNPNPSTIYPDKGGVDWTIINPQPRRKTFFEFAQTFWHNTINVRNRQFSSNGKTGGYPTLESIYWKYIQSEEFAELPNNNFKYENMIEYVNGMGDYWIRLIEQMVPATTIWNTGIKMENSIFHRQKFVWRRQEGCQLIPGNAGGTQVIPPVRNPNGGPLVEIPPSNISVPILHFRPSENSGENNNGYKGRPPLCRPCALISNIFEYDCNVESIECPIYPWLSDPQVTSISGVLGKILNNYLNNNGYELNDCVLNTLTSEWYIELKINNVTMVQTPFFSGVTYSFVPFNAPTQTEYYNALVSSLNSLKTMGYDYYFTDNDTVVVYNQTCQTDDNGLELTIDIGINFQIYCS